MHIVWTDQAKSDLTAQIRYLASHDREAAQRLRTRVHNTIIGLQDMPKRGRPGTVEYTRELVIPNTPHIAVYGIVADVIEIYHIYYEQQNQQDEG